MSLNAHLQQRQASRFAGVPLVMTEAQLSEHVRQTVAALKLYGYHTHRSQNSEKGFPDWVIFTRRGLLWRELKDDKRELEPEQAAVLDMLRARGQDAGVWRPADWHNGTITREISAA